ncbi:uncharacterized protein TNCV_579071 [Trichonephila clavipes]|nr:uncharacterized protein TNCV_579071 [Trichonephila clavipes]
MEQVATVAYWSWSRTREWRVMSSRPIDTGDPLEEKLIRVQSVKIKLIDSFSTSRVEGFDQYETKIVYAEDGPSDRYIENAVLPAITGINIHFQEDSLQHDFLRHLFFISTDIPQLTLRLGSKLRHSHIQEGNDVYLDCSIIASPWVSEIGWRFGGKELHTNTSAGIIVSNQSLVLQKVQRTSRGHYTCVASNSEGEGESNVVQLRVQYGDRFNSCQVIYSQFGLAIHQNDHQARRRFVEWAQNEIAVVPDFHKRILFSDEAHFWLNGYVDKQNCRIWSEANPQVYVETPLHPEKLTVWCALWAGGIIGPYFFKNDEGHNVTVNGDRYRAMITNFFIPELNNHDVQ